MPFNAATGVYTPAAGAESAAPGALIQSAIWNAIFTDLSAALTSVGQLIGTAPNTPTNIVSPVIIGGTAASSTLTLESTSGAGTTDKILLKTGSQATAVTVDTSQRMGIGVTPSHLLDLKAGSTTIAPLRLASGTNLTTAVAGVVEYDGTSFYSSPNASNRGVSPSEFFLSLNANQTGTNGTAAQTWFPGGGATQITLPSSTSYFFEGRFSISRSAGTNSHTISLLFGGGASFTSIHYVVWVTDQAASSPSLSTPQMVEFNVVSAQNITAASANAAQWNTVYVRGLVRINVGGTFIPQFKYDVAPGGAPTVQTNAFFRMYPVGTDTVLSVGNWS